MDLFFSSGLALAASFIPLGLSLWMLGRRGRSLPGCGHRSACDEVTSSRWASVGPIPVVGLGAFAYFLLGVAPAAWLLPATTAVYAFCREITCFAALLAAGGAAWFLLVQVAVLRRLCLYCLAIHAGGLIAATLALLPFGAGHPITPIPMAAAGACLAGLVIGQLVLRPRRYALTQDARCPAPCAPPPVEAAPAKQTPGDLPAPVGRSVRLHGGRSTLDVGRWPVIGPSNARHVIAWLFDHTCTECHQQHGFVREAVARFAGQLTVLAVPVPMYPSCNPLVKCLSDDRVQACAYARLSWAVWIAAPERYGEWDAFMSEGADCQPFGLALKRASELADISQFKITGRDLELDERIAAGVEIYRRSALDSIPALLLPGGVLRGRVSTADELHAVLKKHLAPRQSRNGVQPQRPGASH